MSLTIQEVKQLFESLVAGDIMAFFTDSVDDGVVWTIGNPNNKTCVLSGQYQGKHATAMALSQLSPYFSAEAPARTAIEEIFVSDDRAFVLHTTIGTSTTGLEWQDRAAWVCRLSVGKSVTVDSYCDTAAVNQ